MNQTRRQLLMYLGLGFTGAVGASYGLHRDRSVSASPPRELDLSLPSSRIAASGDLTNTPLPEFVGISDWLNSSPLTVTGLKGKVVAVQFWAFGCINSQRTLPYLVDWHKKYADQGLVIVGVHTPELQFEYDVSKVKEAVQERDIRYPVAIDNEYRTWRAYRNRYWPHLFLANREGKVVYDHIGEGAYDETEATIRQLLASA
ncbi:MAG: redoxin family protein [Thermosynechococcaceae cyanobacterium]